MKRLLTLCLAIWMFVLGPGLCLAGELAHTCDDCAEESFCEHENECTADPCADPAVQAQMKGGAPWVLHPAPVDDRITLPRAGDEPPRWWASSDPPTANLPRPESDLPLLR